MRKLLLGIVVLAYSASPCRAAGLQLSIENGRVSIDAQDVTIRQILNEWARVGKTRIVNAERLTGAPITLKFEGLPEKQALDIILRAVPGYIAAPRAAFVANTSVYDTILLMPTTTAVAALRSPAPAPGRPQGPAGNITQLRQAPPYSPGAPAGFPDPAADQPADPMDDPAIAAAAAAGLVTVPAPGPSSFSAPFMMPGGVSPSGPPASTPAPATPSNPWNAPVGTPQPSLAPPPVAAPQSILSQPPARGRPPQADR